MGLLTVDYIKKYGLDRLLVDYKLKSYDHGYKVLLKYSMLESDLSESLVQECRGLVLEKDTWEIMSYPFNKFFNLTEPLAPELDWSNVRVLEKVDGTFIHLYWDWYQNTWVCGTSGNAEAEGPVNNRNNFTFKELFWETVKNKYQDFTIAELNTRFVYMFELTTPYNTVVKKHKESALTLLGVRNLDNLEELEFETVSQIASVIKIPIVKVIELKSNTIKTIISTFDSMPYNEEGYVVMDDFGCRVKIKNPAYVTVHHLKDKFNSYNIILVIKTNEIDEFNATFPERTDEVLNLKKRYDEVIKVLEGAWDDIKEKRPKNYADRVLLKKFSQVVFEKVESDIRLKSFTGVFFSLSLGKVGSVRQYLEETRNKVLYLELNNKKWDYVNNIN